VQRTIFSNGNKIIPSGIHKYFSRGIFARFYFIELKKENWFELVDSIRELNYAIADNFLDAELYLQLLSFKNDRVQHEEFNRAAIGQGIEKQRISEIRGDYTYWINREEDQKLKSLFELLDEMKQFLNRTCYLSLSNYEFHLAHYPKGNFYKRHLDEFQERSNRMISFILYMNDNWQKGDGGELKIFDSEEDILINPIANRLVMFVSDCVEHEVLMTHKSRFSLTGWFLYQPKTLGFLT